ncbi:MAG TPA: hypothetical protein IAC21_01900 [Candidatus Enterenecus merdae]|nr:hypothetical protein [Candidatus Enterenecus merdae]
MRAQISRGKHLKPRPATRRSVELELAWASGGEAFQHRDPLAHVTEQFQMTFDRIGRRHAAALAEEWGSGFSQEEGRLEAAGLAEQQALQTGRVGRKEGGSVLPGSAIPLELFSQTAFQRGTLSGAVLAGTGKMMLVSCLKRTVGQSEPKQLQQQTLFGVGSQRRNIPGHDPDMVQFNRGVAKSAVGVVVDTLRDARRTVQSMEDLARGCGELEADEGGATLRTMYPFLDDNRERGLAEAYQRRLQQTRDPQEVPVLQSALVHVSALIQKKAQMKNEFINKLRLLADRATQTLEELEAPGALEEIAAALLGQEETWPEPPEGEEPPDDPEHTARRGPAPDGRAPGAGAVQPEAEQGAPGPGPGLAGPAERDGPGPTAD